MAAPIWVFDTSALLEIKSLPHADRPAVLARMSELAGQGRLRMPKQVIDELKRGNDAVLDWAVSVEPSAVGDGPTFDSVKAVLADVPGILDAAKDAGADEADPYVLALAQEIKAGGADARVVTQETKDVLAMPGKPAKMSLNMAAGILGIVSVPLRGFLHVERVP